MPADRSLAAVRHRYRRMVPLFDAYCAAVESHAEWFPRPITEPARPVNLLSRSEACLIALRNIGHPADELAVTMAESYIERIEDEIRSLADEEPSLDDLVTSYFFAFAGCVPTPENWLSEVEEEQDAAVAELVEQMTDKQHAEALQAAMPLVLERIIARAEGAQ